MAEDEPTSKRFGFTHKVFSLEGCYFALGAERRPYFTLPMGEHLISVDLDRVQQEFGLDPESDDGKLIGDVKNALKYVKVVKPGDAIPNELLDGSASWNFDPKLLARTRGALLNSIRKWYTENLEVIDIEKANVGEETPSDEKVLTAFAKEIKVEGDNPPKQINTRIDRTAGELTYIEAIAERLSKLTWIRHQVRVLIERTRQDAEFGQELMRIDDLLSEPLQKIGSQVKNARRRTFDVLSSLSRMEEHVSYLRGQRDQMRYELIDWDDLIDEWMAAREDPEMPVPVELCHRTYRLLAELYSRGTSWAAMG